MLQLDFPVPSTSSSGTSQSSSSYDPVPLDCSKRASEAESTVTAVVPSSPPAPIKRKKISYAIEDLLKKDDS